MRGKPIILSCGLSGAGKTLNSFYLGKGLEGYEVIGIGAVRKELGIKNWSRKDTPLVLSKVLGKIERLNEMGRGAVIDANMRSSDVRQFYYDLATHLGIEAVAIEFFCDERECKRRMAHRNYLVIDNPNDPKFYDQQKAVWQGVTLDVAGVMENRHVSALMYDTVNQKAKVIRVTEKSKTLVQKIVHILTHKETYGVYVPAGGA